MQECDTDRRNAFSRLHQEQHLAWLLLRLPNVSSSASFANKDAGYYKDANDDWACSSLIMLNQPSN